MKKKIDLEKESPAVALEKLAHFKKLFPEAVSEGCVDVEALRRSLGENVVSNDERYNLDWAGKTEAFKALQTSTTATLAPCPEESVDFEKTGNVFIEGENLEVLKVLQKAYYGKIKMIYIDPPYNTGSDSFIYPDRFQESKEEYLKRIEEKDEEGYLLKEGLFRKNSKENGHYHSNWLSMMYPRLFLARNLLRDDGVIFVSIDDNEVHNLRLLMNEIFGEENFLAQLVWKKKTGAGAKTHGFIQLHEYVLCYFKNADIACDIEIPYSEKTQEMYNKKDEYFKILGPYATWPLDTTSMDERKNLRFPIIHNGQEIWPKKQWLWSKEKVLKAQAENKLIFNKQKDDTWTVRFKGYLYDEHGNMRKGKPLSLFDGPYTQEGTKDFEMFFDREIFPFPKPVSLLKRLFNCFIGGQDNKSDIIVDFFAGSCTTANAVFELNKEDEGNRKFICVQLPEKCDEDSEAYKSGYKTIAEIGKERIRRVIKKIKENIRENKDLFSKEKPNLDMGVKVYKLKNSNFKIWRGDVVDTAEDLEIQMDLLKDPVKPEAQEQNLLWELLLKSGYDLNTEITEQKAGKCRFYSVAGGELAVILSKADEKCLQEIVRLKPRKVICLDNIFEANDQLKTNTALQMKDAGIEFRTI